MSIIHGFKLLKKQEIPELKSAAFFYRHLKTGAELLSMVNEDENKVFGISFRTPPSDSTGLPHILEHSVLCGSRKYPVKEPFVELLKGSLQTFLNAMTYPDKTCYPVASQNAQDFYNLIDVYLDAVFYPRITEYTFQQEGWHYELQKKGDSLSYKGVVFNEMKGAYSSPDSLLSQYSMQSIFPDNAYGLDSGGDPKKIPELTFERFKAFHDKYYHPSNSRIYFYGDDDPDKRLFITNGYLADFNRIEVDSSISVQPRFDSPRRVIRPFAVGKDDHSNSRGMLTLNWLLPEVKKIELTFSMHILEYILLGMPGSPLRKALIESNLGEDIAGGGLSSEIMQMYFSTGLKGIELDNADRIVSLINSTLSDLAGKGIDDSTIEAAVNSIEFGLRENNTGSLPRGLALMLSSLTTWLYDYDPLSLVAFEGPLNAVKAAIASDDRYFEKIIEEYFLENPHRTTLILRPDPDLEEKEKKEEEQRLEGAKKDMSEADIEKIISSVKTLKELQEKPDTPEDLATIPMLRISDLDKYNKMIPIEKQEHQGVKIMYHDLFTNGIAYVDVGFNLRSLPGELLPYVRLFSRALLEMGTDKEDYVALSQRISRKTGGIWPAFFTSTRSDNRETAAWMFLRGKAMSGMTGDLLEILRDVILGVRLDNRDRFRQMVLESKAREEQKLVPAGHQAVNLRIRSHFSKADWAAEQMNGISYLFFLRKLAKAVDDNWDEVLINLKKIHAILVNRKAMVVNATQDRSGWKGFSPLIDKFFDEMPFSGSTEEEWTPGKIPDYEGMIIPSQVNYVGKGANLYNAGYGFKGTIHVISRFLRNSWLWDRVRVQGGAYGSFCLFDRFSGTLTFVSYRDPNLLRTIDIFDESAGFLRDLEINDEELAKSIIGSIGDIDSHKLPDAKGYSSMIQELMGDTDEERQKIRDEILATKADDFREFSNVLESVREKGLVKILGSETAIRQIMEQKPGWLEMVKVL
ncbi:MAG: insulinase family protein [Deltaproteobacteria bacterium]|nr:insulinase family protein [Deltaproteobacteria bacterium]